MFGLGLGGISVQLFPEIFSDDRISDRLSTFALILAFGIVIAPLVLFKVRVPTNIFQFFSGKTSLFLAIAFLLSALPFFFGGVITTLLFRAYSISISKLYFADLVGASTGCLLAIPLIELFGASTAIILNAAFACVGALFFLFGSQAKLDRASLKMPLAFFIFFISLAILNMATSVFDIRYAKGTDSRLDEFSKWNSISRVAVSRILREDLTRWVSENIWGVSKNFKGQYPAARMINIDAEAGTFLTNFKNNFNLVDYIQYDPPSIVHRLKAEPETLVIGSGGGKDVLTALSFGAKHVTAVELNPIIVNDVMLNKYREFSGSLYLHPKVKAVADEGRSFISSSKNRYDIIQLSYVDTSAATSGGAYVLAENNLYTLESIKQFLNHLRAGGIFSVCWVDVPGLLGSTRLIATGVAALEESGIKDIGQNIMVVTYTPMSGWMIQDILLKLTPFSKQEQEIVLAACQKLGFEPTYLPMRDNSGFAVFVKDSNKYLVNALINNKEERERLFSSLPLNIRPTTDDKPFFYYQGYPKDFFKTIKFNVAPGNIAFTSGNIVLIKVLLVGFIMIMLFYIIPLVYSFWNRKIIPYGRLQMIPFLFYFSSIGMGFMLVEIVFLQKLLLFLGHPMYTLSVTLLSILFFAGLGSLCTQRFTVYHPSRYIGPVILSLLLVGIFYIFYLPGFFRFFLGYPKGIKILIAVITVMPLAFLMGMPFPLAIKVLQERMNQAIPWMWSINGATSVLASIIAIILAMNIGYNLTFAVGCLCYLVAFFIGRSWHAGTFPEGTGLDK